MKKDRLFVPLSTEPFLDFKERGKQYEVRACARGFSEKFVYGGRAVELRKGYFGESLWGKVGEVYIGKLENIFKKIDLKLIEPLAKSNIDALREDKEMLGNPEKYIVFQVVLADTKS